MATANDVAPKLVELSTAAMTQVFKDWVEMIDLDFRVEAATARTVDDGATVDPPPRSMVIETKIEGSLSGPLYFSFPCSLAAPAIGKMMMLPIDVVSEKAASGDLGKIDLEAFQELANLLCGSSNRALRKERRQLRVSQNVEHLSVRQAVDGDANPCSLPAEPHIVIEFDVAYDGQSHRVLQIVSTQLGEAIGATGT